MATLALGELMREAGYAPEGADPNSNFAGVMPWGGSLRDIERHAKDVTKRRDAAQATLDDALLDDDERAKRDAEAKARRAALDALPTRKVRGDGSQYDRYGGRGDVAQTWGLCWGGCERRHRLNVHAVPGRQLRLFPFPCAR